MKKAKTGALVLGVAFVWFTTHFGGGFASGAQIYSYFVRYGAWCIVMPVLAMAYNGIFFAYSLRFGPETPGLRLPLLQQRLLREVRPGFLQPV